MKTAFRWSALAALLLCAASAQAQTASANGQATGTAAGQAQAGPTSTSTEISSSAEASAKVEARDREQIERIRARGARASAKARAKTDAQLAAAAKRVNETSNNGEHQVAERLAAEFNLTAETLMEERATLGAGWGELMIAHTLIANTNSDATMEQLFQLRQEDTGWGQIAAGMGFNLGELVSAVNAESRVATGLAKADGTVAVVHGEGARAGARADAGARVGAQAGHAGAGVGVGVNAGTSASVPSVKIH